MTTLQYISELRLKISHLEDQVYLGHQMEESYKATIDNRLQERKGAQQIIERLGKENEALRVEVKALKSK